MAKPKFLDKDTVNRIRDLYATEEYTQEYLAKKYSISQSTICKIVNNYTHKTNTNMSLSGDAIVKTGYKWL